MKETQIFKDGNKFVKGDYVVILFNNCTRRCIIKMEYYDTETGYLVGDGIDANNCFCANHTFGFRTCDTARKATLEEITRFHLEKSLMLSSPITLYCFNKEYYDLPIVECFNENLCDHLAYVDTDFVTKYQVSSVKNLEEKINENSSNCLIRCFN